MSLIFAHLWYRFSIQNVRVWKYRRLVLMRYFWTPACVCIYMYSSCVHFHFYIRTFSCVHFYAYTAAHVGLTPRLGNKTRQHKYTALTFVRDKLAIQRYILLSKRSAPSIYIYIRHQGDENSPGGTREYKPKDVFSMANTDREYRTVPMNNNDPSLCNRMSSRLTEVDVQQKDQQPADEDEQIHFPVRPSVLLALRSLAPSSPRRRRGRRSPVELNRGDRCTRRSSVSVRPSAPFVPRITATSDPSSAPSMIQTRISPNSSTSQRPGAMMQRWMFSYEDGVNFRLLNQSVSPSVRPSVRQSVRPSVCPPVRPSDCLPVRSSFRSSGSVLTALLETSIISAN